MLLGCRSLVSGSLDALLVVGSWSGYATSVVGVVRCVMAIVDSRAYCPTSVVVLVVVAASSSSLVILVFLVLDVFC